MTKRQGIPMKPAYAVVAAVVATQAAVLLYGGIRSRQPQETETAASIPPGYVEAAVTEWRNRPWCGPKVAAAQKVANETWDKHKVASAVLAAAREKSEANNVKGTQALWAILNEVTGSDRPVCIVRSGKKVWFVEVTSDGQDRSHWRWSVAVEDVLVIGDIRHVQEDMPPAVAPLEEKEAAD